MFNNDFFNPDSWSRQNPSLTSLVKLQKDWQGIVHARPILGINMMGSRTYKAKNSADRTPAGAMVLITKNDHSVKSQSAQKQPSKPKTSVSPAKGLNKKWLVILFTAGSILLISKHKSLLNFPGRLRSLFIKTV